jgi:hypothetical protein
MKRKDNEKTKQKNMHFLGITWKKIHTFDSKHLRLFLIDMTVGIYYCARHELEKFFTGFVSF